MDTTLPNRRRFLSAIAASSAAIPTTVMATAPIAPEISEVISLFEGLNAERKRRMLLLLRDCSAAQRLSERGATAPILAS